MQLFYSTASPYARKVVVAAREAGIIDRIDIIATNASPVDRNQEIVSVNPTGKIPTLVLEDGRSIFDSRVICEYINGLDNNSILYPTGPDALLAAQTLHALGDGILDASLLVRYETFMRPEQYRWAEWTNGQREKVRSSLDYLENQCIEQLHSPLSIGQIAIACALAYIDFREIIEDWKSGHGKLAKWFVEFSKRESMRATEPR